MFCNHNDLALGPTLIMHSDSQICFQDPAKEQAFIDILGTILGISPQQICWLGFCVYFLFLLISCYCFWG